MYVCKKIIKLFHRKYDVLNYRFEGVNCPDLQKLVPINLDLPYHTLEGPWLNLETISFLTMSIT